MGTMAMTFEFGGRHFCWSFVWLLCCLTTLVAASVLQIQQVLVPTQVMSGSNVVLRCLFSEIDSNTTTPTANRKFNPNEHDQAVSALYCLKWYKGSHEFYRHVPRENPPITLFHWSHFNIEADASEPGKVILRGVTAEAEGTYNCEVSSEGTFHTDRAEANLTVIDVQNEALTLVQEPPVEEAKPGDRLRWNCTFGQSRPPANIMWIVNGEPVAPSSRYAGNSRSAEGSTNSPDGLSKQLEWVDSILELSLAERHFKSQWLRVSCVVQIGAGFKKTKEIHVRQYGTGGRSAHHNPSAVVGPNVSRTSSSSSGGDLQPSMAKIAGSQRASSAGGLGSATGSTFAAVLMASLFILLQTGRIVSSRF